MIEREKFGPLPDEFFQRYEELLGNKADKFFEYLVKPLRPSIRVNTLKISPDELREKLEKHYGWQLEEVKWVSYAYYLENTIQNPGATLEHATGLYYVQETSSMIPVIVLDPKPGELVLDIAAAPGSKTTQLCQEMENTGGILANEASRGRIAILYNNLKRFGAVNVRVRLGDGRRIPGEAIFDRSLVDVPCSSEATISKTWLTAKRWSPGFIHHLSKLQKGLLKSAIKLTKPGGTIVYSTCTFEPEENEMVIDWALENLPVELEKVKVKALEADRGLPGFQCSDKVLRIWPWHEMEGFFIAKLVRVE